MGRYGIDYLSVKEAAEALVAAGESVTVEKIRLALGSGSFTTLGKHLRTWRRTQDPAVGDATAMPEMINDAAQAVWSNLSRAAEQRIAEAQAAAQTAVAAAQDAARDELEARDLAHAEAGRAFAQELQHLQGRFDTCHTEREQVSEELAATIREREEAAVRAAEATGALRRAEAQIVAQDRQMAGLTTSLERAEALRATQQQALAAAQDDLRRLQAQHQQAAGQADRRYQEERQIWHAQLAREQQEVDRLRTQEHAQARIIEHLEALREAATASVQGYGALGRQGRQMTDVLQALSEQTAELDTLVQSVVRATQETKLRGLFEESQAATQTLYESLMGAMASGKAPSPPRS